MRYGKSEGIFWLTLFWKPCGLFTGNPLSLLRESLTETVLLIPGFQELLLELTLCHSEELSSNSSTLQCLQDAVVQCGVALLGGGPRDAPGYAWLGDHSYQTLGRIQVWAIYLLKEI